MQQKVIKWIISIFRLLLLSCISFVILYPLFSKISLSFMSTSDLYDAGVIYIPKDFTLNNYQYAFEQTDYFFSLLKTVLAIAGTAFLQVASSLLVGYGFARFDFKFKNFWFGCAILTLIIPAQSIMAPLYFHFKNFNFFGILGDNGLNLLNTYWPIVLLSAGCMGLNNCIYIYMFRQYFKGFPKELEESGQIDGANSFVIFIRIIVPCAVSMIVTAFLFSFVWQWTDTFYINVFMPGNDFLSVLLTGLPTSVGATDLNYQAIMSNVSVILLVLPILVIFLFAQRFFVESIERSGLVG
ncbi:MAG: carbohydrate ABC transporter permease [Clostridia bacterium]|nr:carbohydrate ABC transporter permease [Clostridia bacterium]